MYTVCISWLKYWGNEHPSMRHKSTEVKGFLVLQTVEALGQAVDATLARHGLDGLQSDEWYPQERWLNALDEIVKEDDYDLVEVGRRIAQQLPLPPHIQSLKQFLPLVQNYRDAYHRNGDTGSFVVHEFGDNSLELTITTPYPVDLTFGVIYGYLERFLPQDAQFEFDIVKFNDSGTRYRIRW